MEATESVEICLTICYRLEDEEVEDVQLLRVTPVAPERFLLKQSSGLFSEYKVFFGDEIVVQSLGGNQYLLLAVIEPSTMRHFFFMGSGSPTALTTGLHELGGEWECEMGGLTTFHIPRDQVEDFSRRFGINPKSGSEMFSGVQPFDC